MSFYQHAAQRLVPWASLAFGAFFVGLAQAQVSAPSSLTLYGAIDASVTRVSHANAAGQSVTAVSSGSYLPSVWGVKGLEDLGQGMQAFFKLENSFNVDTGAATTSASFFNRFAYLGLRSDWGTVTAGRLGSMQFDYTAIGYDLTMLDTYGIVALGALPPALFKINNAVKYETPTWAGWRGAVMSSTGQELAEANMAGRYSGGVIEYAQGRFKTRLTHEITHGSVSGSVNQAALKDTRTSLAARWDLETWSFFADYVSIQGDLRITPRGQVVQGGIGYRFAPQWQLIGEAGVYRYSDSDGRPVLAHLVAQYDLSKRTMLYGFWTKVSNHGGSQVGTAFATTVSTPGQSQSALGLGVWHRF